MGKIEIQTYQRPFYRINVLVDTAAEDALVSDRFVTVMGQDGVLNREKYEADRTNLPQDTVETVIDGGCHAGFGSYGAQKGDGTPTISAEEQQQQAADALAAWMNLQ